jgi:hypothetical protein
VPKKVRLVHLVSEPIVPPVWHGERPPDDMVVELHHQLVRRMTDLIGQALSL